MPSPYLYLPHDFADGRPCYWRRHLGDPAFVEITTFKINAQGIAEEARCQVPAWIRNDEHLASLGADGTPDGLALSQIGWSLSFAHRTNDQNWFRAPGVDLVAARSYFMASAEKGCWAALNILGVMARDGLDRAPDPVEAFRNFKRAAESLDPIPLRHLATCYRHGVGTAINQSQATALEELAAAKEAETKTRV